MSELRPELIEVLSFAQEIGAIGPAPLSQHLQHALGFATAIADLLPPRARVVDLGSGGGIPGLVLAEVLPDLTVTLLEGRTMRCELLESSVARLGLGDRVGVLSGRAEDVGQMARWREHFDGAVARGFAAPGVTAECAAPLLKIGGFLCVSEPPAVNQFERWPADGCAELGLEHRLAIAVPHAFVVLVQIRDCPARFPRRTGVPAKRPLF